MTREEAITWLENRAKQIPLPGALEVYRMAIAALRALDAQEKPESFGERISVKDRLPEPSRYVACIAKRNPFSRFMPMVARIEKNGWANPITEQYISEVTHWLPLPEPPKEDKDK